MKAPTGSRSLYPSPLDSRSLEVADLASTPDGLAQEAAVHYANGDLAQARARLIEALGDASDGDEGLPWLMLLDLYRTQAAWHEFEALAERFAARFGRPAPHSAEDRADEDLPAELRHGGSGHREVAGGLDEAMRENAAAIRQLAASRVMLHLDLSRLTAAGPAGCAALSELLRALIANGNGVVLSGARHCAALVRRAAESSPRTAEYWTLLLDLLQVQDQQRDFERTALEYALAADVAAPAWEAVVMPLPPRPAPAERRGAPRYQRGAELIQLEGVVSGAGDAQLERVRTLAATREFVNISMDGLVRLDLAGAAALARLANGLVQAGKTVRLLRPNHLISALLAMLDLDQRVVLISTPRKS